MQRRPFGFTIVELLVVIVVIGILATITIISYTGISRKANEASIVSDLNSAFKKFKLYQIENSGYPTDIELNCNTPTITANICLKPSPNNQYTLANVDNSTPSNQMFCLSILNTAINQKYNVDNTGIQTSGGCPAALTLIAGTNGTVSGGGIYEIGATATIIATPDSGYMFNAWSGDSGCSGTANHTITMNTNKTCTASFVQDPNWIAGITATPLAGKFVRAADLAGSYMYKTSITANASPQAATGLDPSYPTYASLVDPRLNPSVDFSEYPAQNACKAIGGRLPNMQELNAIYTGRASYGNNFQATGRYWSSTEWNSSGSSYWVYFDGGGVNTLTKTNTYLARCVTG